MICVSCARRVAQRRELQARRRPRHLLGQAVGGRVGGDLGLRIAARVARSGCVNGAVPPPPSTPWQSAQSSDLVASYAGLWRWRRASRPARPTARGSRSAAGVLTERLPDEVGEQRDDDDDQCDQRAPAEHALEVRALEDLVVEERREVLGRGLLVVPEAEDPEHDEPEEPDDERRVRPGSGRCGSSCGPGSGSV